MRRPRIQRLTAALSGFHRNDLRIIHAEIVRSQSYPVKLLPRQTSLVTSRNLSASPVTAGRRPINSQLPTINSSATRQLPQVACLAHPPDILCHQAGKGTVGVNKIPTQHDDCHAEVTRLRDEGG